MKIKLEYFTGPAKSIDTTFIKIDRAQISHFHFNIDELILKYDFI